MYDARVCVCVPVSVHLHMRVYVLVHIPCFSVVNDASLGDVGPMKHYGYMFCRSSQEDVSLKPIGDIRIHIHHRTLDSRAHSAYLFT